VPFVASSIRRVAARSNRPTPCTPMGAAAAECACSAGDPPSGDLETGPAANDAGRIT
jgi:hypothetical protein